MELTMLRQTARAADLRVLAGKAIRSLSGSMRGFVQAMKKFGFDPAEFTDDIADETTVDTRPAQTKLSRANYEMLFNLISSLEPLRWGKFDESPPTPSSKLSPFVETIRTVKWRWRTFSAHTRDSFVRYRRADASWSFRQIEELFAHWRHTQDGHQTLRQEFAVIRPFRLILDQRGISPEQHSHRMAVCSDQYEMKGEVVMIEQIICHIAFRRLKAGTLKIQQDFLLVVNLTDCVDPC